MARVTLFSRVGCHLCDQAREVIDQVCEQVGEEFDEVDIDTSSTLQQRYGEEIPVTLVDGRQIGFWTVDPARLRAALQA